jgi:4,5-dihydroxyphthalate decarboxylase
MTYLLRTVQSDEPPFLAIPVFPVRSFRHSAIYVNRASGIQRPEDLAGTTVGELAFYGHDAGVMPKGILSDEFGISPNQCRWVVGGIDFPLNSLDFVPQPHPDDVEVTRAGPKDDLGTMLDTGEIDALVSADAPDCVLRKSPNVGRLFEDYPAVERDYYRRTGIFPIMHTVVAPRGLLAARPGLARTVYNGFLAAKEYTADRYRAARRLYGVTILVPWMRGLLERDQELLGADWWPYGIEANRTTLETFLRYHHEQGLSATRPTIEEVFAEELLDT